MRLRFRSVGGRFGLAVAGLLVLVALLAPVLSPHPPEAIDLATELAPRGIAAVAVAPSTILFGDEDADARGVTADEIASLLVRLVGPDGAAHAGETIRAYGTAG